MGTIENIDPGDSEPTTEPESRSLVEAFTDEGIASVIGELGTRFVGLLGDKDPSEELSPETIDTLGMLGILPAGVRSTAGSAVSKVSGPARSLAAGVSSRTPSQVGRAVSRARSSLRRVNPKRPGSHAQASPPPPLKPTRADRIAARQAGSPSPTQVRGGTTPTLAERTFTGAAARSAAGRHRRMLTGPRGVLSRLGVDPSTRGFARTAMQATAAGSIAGSLALATANGLVSNVGSNLKQSALGGQGSSPASDQARARAVDQAMTEALRGNVQEAEDMLADAGVSPQQVAQAMDAAEQARQQRNPSPTTQPEEPPGRTLQQQTDSLADNANQPGLPPTARQAVQGQQDAAAGLALAEQQAQLANEGRLPPVYVSEGPQVTGPPGTERTNLRRTNQVLGDIFDMERDELIDLQHKLFAAGFFGARNYDSIRFGAKDPATMTAFQGFLEQAAQKTNRAISETGAGFGSTQGGRVTAPTGISSWRTTLERWAMDAGGVEGQLEDEDPTFVVSLTDPEAIKSQMNELSRNVIGRGISPRAEQRFVSMFHGRQREAQLEAQRAQQQSQEAQLQGQRNRAMALKEMQRETGARPGQQGQGQQSQQQPQGGQQEQVVEVTQPSVEGQAQSFLESEFPTESGAFSTVQQYDDFLSIIGATRG